MNKGSERKLIRHNGCTYEFGISWISETNEPPNIDGLIEGWGKDKIAAIEEHMPPVGLGDEDRGSHER